MALSLWPKNTSNEGITQYPIHGYGHEIDLRQEFIDLIDGTDLSPQRGHWVILRKMDTRQHCSCWGGESSKYDEPNANCHICLGEGWIYSEELHNIRKRVVTPPPGMGGMEQQTEFAIMNIPYVVYYFKYYVRPTELDKIIEIDNNYNGDPVRPLVKRETYNITFAESFRDQNGRIEYWRCSVKKEEIRNG